MRKLFVPLALLVVLLTACGGAPQASPTPPAAELPPPGTVAEITEPAPTVTPDLPSISAEEMAAVLWNKLPDPLPDGHSKSHLDASTANVSYQGKGKWTYSVSGSVSEAHSLPYRDYEKTPDNWVRNFSEQVKTTNLLLRADYYEETSTLSILGVDKSETTSEKTINETPIHARELKLNWIAGSTTGFGFRVEGSVTNTGILPLENVIFEVAGYDGTGAFLGTDNITLSPARINVGENCKFVLDATGFYLHASDPSKGKVTFGRFTYRFLLPSGKTIYVKEAD